ncbi:MAG: carbohydrate binding family 9 domain-containing protein [candidate division Zixibacteria bacterium]|nr:carbohydrate binding family 9 domain-containing protein [Candidatus Tariuqbacter arcticus]
MRFSRRVIISIIYILLIIVCFHIDTAYSRQADKVFTITRTNIPPDIDGDLNDEAWLEANSLEEFLQMEPDRFNSPSEHTILKMLYDDEAIYISFHCFDSQPALIKTTLRRRDEDPPADQVAIAFDCRDDNQTAFVFKLTAGGTMCDFYLFDDGNELDNSWNAVWEAEAAVNDGGWAAELKIPFTALRFPPAQNHTWGMQALRRIDRKGEEVAWPVFAREEAGYISHFAELRGIKNIPQPFNLEVLPYFSSKYKNTYDEIGFLAGIGGDLKYSLSSGVILNATVNPDFGQVEADPSVLNLGVFETYYPEKRPFFLEGADIFNTPYTMFYSRRIGKSPGYYDCQNDEEIISEPENTTILNALKITGKTSEGISFGVMEAFTDREYAEVEDEDGNKRDMLLEPYANYFVGRIIKDLWAGNSSIGAIATAMNREGGMSAYTGGFDWNLYFRENDYNLSGQAAFSDRGDSPDDRESGYGIDVGFEKSGGKHHGFEFELEAQSPDFNIRDMGFLDRADEISGYAEYFFRTREPVGIFRRTISGIETWQDWNYNGDHIANGIGFETNLQYLNYWDTNFGGHYNFPRYSDLETRGGPLLRPPANYGGWFWGGTDWKKDIRASINFWGGENTFESWWWGGDIGLIYRPIDRMETSIYINYERTFDENQWVENIEDESDSTHYVFGRLNQSEWTLTARLSYNFTRDMSFQLYLQPFNAVGEYVEYVELAQPGTYKFQPYDPGDDYDFNWKNLNLNAVFRWEYAPGSVVFLVWNRGMEDEEYPGRFEIGNNMSDLAAASADDIFLIKINRWFNF